MVAQPYLHLDLDGAWPNDVLPEANYLDLRHWGAKLRYCSNSRLVEEFFEEMRGSLADFTLYGSGDFHYVTALLLRRIDKPFTLVSFDNHPDWDIRPPHWCCGTWLNRALELPNMGQAVIWGCSNGELNWPGRLFAKRSRQLHAHPWAEKTVPSSQKIWPAVSRQDWREKFTGITSQLPAGNIYVTVDIDCLTAEDAVTNWESGMFTANDVAWALGELHRHGRIIGGDLCGAYSPIKYARPVQRALGKLDHPAAPKEIDAARAAEINTRALRTIWPALIHGNQRDSGADQDHTQPERG